MNKTPVPANAATSAIRAYLGGSFNPVHNGHIQMAMQVYKQLLPYAKQQQRPLQVSLLPNARSPFKQKTIAPEHRLAMLKLAIQNTPLQISELELWQAPPVYSIDTVRTLRQRYPNDSLIFIMGMDSARSLDKWKEGLQLTDYVHLWIFNRADTDPNLFIAQNCSKQTTTFANPLPSTLKRQVTDTCTDLLTPLLKNKRQGRIYIDSYPITTISSTQIRQQLQTGLMTPNNLKIHLNPTVYHYIITHQLYSVAQFR